MNNPVIPARFLAENPMAASLHQRGLEAQLNGDYDEARNEFSQAAGILTDTSGNLNLSAKVQLSRVTRDLGFTYVRQALQEDTPAVFDDAERKLTYAAALTQSAMLEEEFRLIADVSNESLTARAITREVIAEHGATLGLLGRAATARAVLLGIDTRGDGEVACHERSEEQRWYGRDYAHGYLRQGSNGYYRVSNAMNGARQEKINGQFLRMLPWLGRAATGLAWTAAHDRGNFKDAAKTFSGRLPHLRSHQAAKKSVLVKP